MGRLASPSPDRLICQRHPIDGEGDRAADVDVSQRRRLMIERQLDRDVRASDLHLGVLDGSSVSEIVLGNLLHPDHIELLTTSSNDQCCGVLVRRDLDPIERRALFAHPRRVRNQADLSWILASRQLVGTSSEVPAVVEEVGSCARSSKMSFPSRCLDDRMDGREQQVRGAVGLIQLQPQRGCVDGFHRVDRGVEQGAFRVGPFGGEIAERGDDVRSGHGCAVVPDPVGVDRPGECERIVSIGNGGSGCQARNRIEVFVDPVHDRQHPLGNHPRRIEARVRVGVGEVERCADLNDPSISHVEFEVGRKHFGSSCRRHRVGRGHDWVVGITWSCRVRRDHR